MLPQDKSERGEEQREHGLSEPFATTGSSTPMLHSFNTHVYKGNPRNA